MIVCRFVIAILNQIFAEIVVGLQRDIFCAVLITVEQMCIRDRSLADEIGVLPLWSITGIAILYDIWRLKGDGLLEKQCSPLK